MPKITKENAGDDLVSLAIAGIDARISELLAKKEDLLKKRAVKTTPAAPKRSPKASAEKAAPASAPEKKKRVFSPATRRKLREAAKARWQREKEQKAAE